MHSYFLLFLVVHRIKNAHDCIKLPALLVAGGTRLSWFLFCPQLLRMGMQEVLNKCFLKTEPLLNYSFSL